MGIHTGKSGVVKVGPTPTAVASITNFSLNDGIGVVASKAMGADYVTQLTTQKQWSASIECELDHGDAGQDLFVVGDSIAVELHSEGDGSGKKYWSGTALVITADHAVPSDGMATSSISVAGSGALTKETTA